MTTAREKSVRHTCISIKYTNLNNNYTICFKYDFKVFLNAALRKVNLDYNKYEFIFS